MRATADLSVAGESSLVLRMQHPLHPGGHIGLEIIIGNVELFVAAQITGCDTDDGRDGPYPRWCVLRARLRD